MSETFPAGWSSAAVKPPAPGWYERHYIDGIYAHHWTGEHWTATKDGKPHWRQLADAPYPLWRAVPDGVTDHSPDAGKMVPGVNPSALVQMPDKARAGIEALHCAIESLLTTGRFVDEEGEATHALADLAECIANPPFKLKDAHGVQTPDGGENNG